AAGADRLSSADAWTSLVSRAVDEAVDLVLLAGDVVDRFNRSFEAYGPLQQGIRSLKAAGIPVVAVAGNHDYDSLPDVAAEVGEGHLAVLGRGGAWERWTLRGENGAARLHVDGWSFPDQHWRDDPTAGYDPAALGAPGGVPGSVPGGVPGSAPGDVPVLGLVHGDLDQPGSRYGPLATSRLRSFDVAAWVLGHIHTPMLREEPGSPAILYPGSVQALDAGERGPHGAWILELEGGRRPVFRPVALSGVRYDRIDVDVDGVDDAAALNAAVRQSLQQHVDRLGEESVGPLKVVYCQVRLTGHTRLHGDIEAALDGLGALEIPHDAGFRLLADPRPLVDTRPALDLAALSKGSDAPALLARLLLALDGDGEGAGRPDGLAALPDGLAGLASQAADAAAGSTHYVSAGLDPLDLSPGSRRLGDGLRRQAARLLDALMTQSVA
ncbi:MAG: DNA repair exonuclease, partial [Gemmatimonadota bacterium]